MVVASTGFSKSLVAAAAAAAVVVKCEMIGKIWKKSKLNSEKISETQKKIVK
jgi:hypothetical protein